MYCNLSKDIKSASLQSRLEVRRKLEESVVQKYHRICLFVSSYSLELVQAERLKIPHCSEPIQLKSKSRTALTPT